MLEKISTPVSVSLAYDHKKRAVFPRWVVWDGRLYAVRKVGLHHTYREGRTLFHVFSVTSRNLFLRLVLNSESLHWRLEEVSDGLPS